MDLTPRLEHQMRIAPIIIGRSEHAQKMRTWAEMVGPTDNPVLLLGPTGSGKDRMAKAIHRFSHQKGKFVVVNCMAIPESLFESELFGRGRGAFTGAITDTKGRFGMAERGSIFLNEVAELPTPIQAKLLEILDEEKVYHRVGEDQSLQSTARIIAATNIEVTEAVKQGKLRSDLYYRLNVLTFRVPPLRDRRVDIPDLVDYFLKKEACVKKMAPEALTVLAKHDWPGNVRELENTVIAAATLSKGSPVIGPEHVEAHLGVPALPAEEKPPLERGSQEQSFKEHISALRDLHPRLQDSLEMIESLCVKDAIEKAGGNMRKASQTLGLSYKTTTLKVQRYDLREYARSLRKGCS